MTQYNPKSLKAEEFINDEEIQATLQYADENKDNFALIDEIIEKFNAHYANAGAEMEEMIDALFNDEDLRMNVKNSAPSAYEYAANEKLSERINTHMLDGLMTGNQEKVEYYNELSGDTNTQKQICNRIIRKIKDWLNLAG